MQNLLSKSLVVVIAILPFISPMGVEWFPLVSSISLKTAWGIIGVSILFVAWIFFNNKIVVKKSKLYYPILGFIIWCFISLFWIKSTYPAILMLAQFTSYGLVFFLVLNFYKNLKDAEALLKAIVISLTLVSIIGILQSYFIDNYFVQSFFVQAVGPSSTFGNKNIATHFVVMALPVSIVFYLNSKNSKNLALYALSIFIGLWYLYLTQARQAYLAIAVEVFILLLFILIDFIRNKDRSFISNIALKKIKILPIIFVVASLLVIGVFKSNEVVSKIQSLDYKSSMNARLPAWKNTLVMIEGNLLIGVGVGQWSEAYPLYYDKIEKDVIFNEKTRLRRLHNDYLEMLADVGLIGYIFLLWLVFLIGKRIWFVLTSAENKDRVLAMGIALGVTGFGVVSIFSYPIHTYLPVFLLLTYFGLLELSFINNYKRSFGNLYISTNIAIKLFSVLLLLLTVIYSMRWMFSEHNYFLAREYGKDERFNLAINAGVKAVKFNPLNARNYIVTGNNYLKSKDSLNAVKQFNQAVKLMPFNVLTLLNLASAYKMSGNIQMEHKTLNTVLSIDPNNVIASTRLVRAFVEKKRYKEATIAFRNLKDNFEYFKDRSGFGPYHDMVAQVAIFVGDYQYARYIYNDAISREESADNLMKLATLEFFNLKNLDIGTSLYIDAIKLDSNSQRFEEIENYIKGH
ncbi:O-antigen ligase family protein [Candidatus Thioglobus autotrophicus]|uniref:O-antigen ligase family protein n=1 Tax=Candidatus Thioglobus autotrophicus TaxID=1705394 RepID=UPI00299D153E|nr:O-antigen ligase family protein [Candidatus Thioglobus autotrophicus]WPE18751.1 O-antigen ligase family protein [Candidatus Thioglobus autotrophicus]